MCEKKMKSKEEIENCEKKENEKPFRFAYPYFKDSNICVIAGRPGARKTAFAIDFGKYIAKKEKKNIVYFNFSNFKKEMEEQYGEAENLHFDDVAENIKDIIKICREQKKADKVDVVMIDTIQTLLRKYRDPKKYLIQVQKAVKTLKALSEELGIPIMILSQLQGNAGTKKVKNMIPPFLHLSEMGLQMPEIDNLFFLYRDPQGNEARNDSKTFLECNILKPKNNGRIRMRFAYENHGRI